jgi:hypothetical protein
MKLKALHHSILVKAEFFMKQKGNRVFRKNFHPGRLSLFSGNLCFVICKRQEEETGNIKKKRNKRKTNERTSKVKSSKSFPEP